jgi:hypothetical protein
MSTCPFSIGKRYQVLADIEEMGHVLKAGVIVVFINSAYDPHNGVTRYWFKNQDSEVMNVWHVWDNDQSATEQWKKFFQECES